MNRPPTASVAYIVPHTHWDREWYEPAVRFRQRLVGVVDGVLDLLERDRRVNAFLLDGQLVVVEDYLAVRPEARDRLARLVESGRLLVGPWYVLADELLVSDETLVRNLAHGKRAAQSLGEWFRLGYSPDAFGHPAALPTILKGFDIDSAIVWRGYGGEYGQDGDLFEWESPDGSRVLTHHLPPAGYEFGSELPSERDPLLQRWAAVTATLAPRTTVPAYLVLNGADHHGVQSNIGDVLDTLNDSVEGVRFVVASPLVYFKSAARVKDLHVVTGELRFSYRYTWTLQGVHAVRSQMKQAIAEAEQLLTRWAEPQAALAAAGESPDRRHLLREAWRMHLQNCAHDSIGGCCSDHVAHDVARRAANVIAAARGITRDALIERAGQDPTVMRRVPELRTPHIAILNASSYARQGVAFGTVTFHCGRVTVGGRELESMPSTRALGAIRRPVLLDPAGQPVPVQILGQYTAHERLDSNTDYPEQDVVTAVRVAIDTVGVPALGLTMYEVVEGDDSVLTESPVHARRGSVRNGEVAVFATGPGMTVRGPNAAESAGITIESELDHGDTYTFQPVKGEYPLIARFRAADPVWPGPLVGCVARDFKIAQRVTGTVSAQLAAGSRLVRFVIEGHNRSGNHRVRVRIPIPLSPPPSRVVADMHYGPVTRPVETYDRSAFPMEWPVTTAPMHRYVTLRSARSGFTVFARGLHEYEVGEGNVWVTLFRSVGQLSRGDLPARPGHAGWPEATPDAQELGAFRAELALAFVGADEDSPPEEWAQVERYADEFHDPLSGMMLRHGIDVPPVVPGPNLEGDGLVYKACKPAEASDAIVLRCVNVTVAPVQGVWELPMTCKKAALARLDETPTRPLRVREGRYIDFNAEPREVVTVLVLV